MKKCACGLPAAVHDRLNGKHYCPRYNVMAMERERRKNNTALKHIARAYGRYNLTTRKFLCRFNLQLRAFEYDLRAAKAATGTRGGHPRCERGWTLFNLYPEQRLFVERFPRLRGLVFAHA